jgi:phytoene synthase
MDVEASYRLCSQVARRSASSFYWSFWLLPREKRRAMCALYAFSRRADDLSDNEAPEESRRRGLAQWRESLERALAGEFDDPLLPALADSVRRFEIPAQSLRDILDGVEMDLTPRRYETFDELRQYCLRVASAVGVACIHIWGFDGDAVYEPAADCGVAFQLTNILRDLKEDAERGRLYLPLEDLRRHHYTERELLAGVCDERFQRLIADEVERAEELYRRSAPLYEMLSSDGRRVLGMMSSTYWRLLQEVKRHQRDLLARRLKLRLGDKLGIAAAHLFRRSPRLPEFLAHDRDAD